ncbi:DUF4169 family protein [Devosia aurantiaca]|uniref:DUF4169 family protein n=1 Tax=Devosia aurantiaca TaxID=2714858 RepID=A0A6M1STB6_9HYPH|nr:DUF4169 family protein [Devosia aurantiaca]NGP17643.1 DUF4169 family protein [Devosia aurantiaca]
MADIINLRNVRKQKARADKDAKASENRVLFGRTKAEKLKDAMEKARADKHVEGHKRDE